MASRTWLQFSLVGSMTLLASLACVHPRMMAAAPEPMGIEMWERNHPEASRELGLWVKNHAVAARQFFAWDAHHPVRSHEFVTWSISHPGEGIKVFAMTHPHWEYFEDIALNHVPAANTFMAWCRRHPEAAEALMNHQSGLDWAGHHLYAGSDYF